ncbi:hypothetical protein NDU88_005420 [Pleurodeles waltl]|uniref:Uncharacterized protein n=1 Tax=Pleurodeles waltl TaxID=8319 RepID=A0AAV7QFL9_PLEWA|nr:hypothetical protein NDU88_005420 [Pleurodeles waltl]
MGWVLVASGNLLTLAGFTSTGVSRTQQDEQYAETRDARSPHSSRRAVSHQRPLLVRVAVLSNDRGVSDEIRAGSTRLLELSESAGALESHGCGRQRRHRSRAAVPTNCGLDCLSTLWR